MTEASNNEVARGQFPRVDSVATRGPFLRSQGRLRGTIRNTYIYIYIKYMSWLRNLCVSLWVPTLFVSESTYVGHVSLRTTRPHRHALKLVGTTPSKYYVYRVCGDVAVASSSSSSSFFFFFNAISFCYSFFCLRF